jgi:hypothetical protein
MTAELDVYALENLGTGCDPGNCLGWGDDGIVFDAFAGRTYYLSVDGRQGEVGEYRIRLECDEIPGPCNPAGALSCGDVLTGESNDQPGSTNAIDLYETCKILNPLDESGPEYAYEFIPSADTLVDVTLSNAAGGTPHVYVLEDRGDGCAADDCIEFGLDSVQFDAVAGTTYYIVVEGFQGSIATYDIRMTCQ